jgi:hypothetical protein
MKFIHHTHRQTVNFDSMKLAQKLVKALEPFYSEAERQNLTQVFYNSIEEDMRAFNKNQSERTP